MLNSATTNHLVDGSDLGGNARLTWRKRPRRGTAAAFVGDAEERTAGHRSVPPTCRPWSRARVRGQRDRDGDPEEILQEQSRPGADLEQLGSPVADPAARREPHPGGVRPAQRDARGPRQQGPRPDRGQPRLQRPAEFRGSNGRTPISWAGCATVITTRPNGTPSGSASRDRSSKASSWTATRP